MRSNTLNDRFRWRMSFLLVSISLIIEGDASDLANPPIITGGATYSSYKFNVLHHLTAISPYFDSDANEINPDPPAGCTVDKAVYLVRHGSIYANDYDYEHTIEPFLQRLTTAKNAVDFSKSAELAFLAHWTSPISNSDEQVEKLTKSGSLEAFNLGTRLAQRYPNLLSKHTNSSFKIWASSANRTKESASALLAGLIGKQETIDRVSLITEEKNQGANTLSPTKTCSIFNISAGTEQADAWLKRYTQPIIARLNNQRSGFQFSAEDILAMQELCGYESVIRGSSPFCKIFTADEWLSFEYYFDIKYYYLFGYGNEISPSLGMPWLVAVSELLNYTIAEGQDLYVNVVHREMLALVVTALGLFNDINGNAAPNVHSIFPLDRVNYQRAWKSSKFVPFLGHIALERLQCTGDFYNGKFIRVLVNSAPQPLPGCADGPGVSCSLAKYMDYIQDRDSIYDDFSKACKVTYQNSTDLLTFF